MRLRLLVLTTLSIALATLASPGSATAAFAMPSRIILTGGAAEVERTYTATPLNYSWPSGVTPRYQWQRGDHDRNATSYVDIPRKTAQRYTLTDADHGNSVRVMVTAWRNGSKIGEKASDPSNWIMYDVKAPILSGRGLVGHPIDGKLGIWATEWQTSVWWRRGAAQIPGATHMSYTPTAADAGKSISMVGLGEYTFPNGVHPIDRDVTHMHVRWETTARVFGISRGPGRLTLTAVGFAKRARQVPAQGTLVVRDGSRLIKSTWLNGRKTIRLRGLRKGTHTITMVFPQAWSFSGARVTHAFTVR